MFHRNDVGKIVDAGCGNPWLEAFHADYRMLQRHYAYEHGLDGNLVSFLSTLFSRITLEDMSKRNLVEQEDFITSTCLAMYRVFVWGLRRGNLSAAAA